MAGQFRFRLEVVERLRRQAQDAQRRVVADAVRAVQRVETRIEHLTRQLADTMDRARGTQGVARLDVVSLRGHQIYRGYLHRQLLQSTAELARRQRELQAERAKLAEASKRLKVIEKLRERHWNRYVTALRREEQAATDEVALQGFLRGRQVSRREVRAC
jgi:flagellar FliJ protein